MTVREATNFVCGGQNPPALTKYGQNIELVYKEVR